MADYTIRDNNTKIRITCLKRDGSFFNLTGHTIKLRFRIRDIDHVPVDMTIIDAVGGIAEYEFGLGSGITITLNTDDWLDMDAGGGTGVIAVQVPAGLYATMDDLCAAVELAMGSFMLMPVCTYDGLTKLVTLGGAMFPTILLFGTGVNAADTIAPHLGFTSTDHDNGGASGTYDGDFIAIPAVIDDLSEEGIMYAEFEITETSTGRLVSSSEVTTFVVRGKVTDE